MKHRPAVLMISEDLSYMSFNRDEAFLPLGNGLTIGYLNGTQDTSECIAISFPTEIDPPYIYLYLDDLARMAQAMRTHSYIEVRLGNVTALVYSDNTKLASNPAVYFLRDSNNFWFENVRFLQILRLIYPEALESSYN